MLKHLFASDFTTNGVFAFVCGSADERMTNVDRGRGARPSRTTPTPIESSVRRAEGDPNTTRPPAANLEVLLPQGSALGRSRHGALIGVVHLQSAARAFKRSSWNLLERARQAASRNSAQVVRTMGPLKTEDF